MQVTVTNNFVALDSADDAAVWAGSVDATVAVINTIEQTEGAGCIDVGKSGITEALFHYTKTIIAADVRDKLLVLWLFITSKSEITKLAIKSNGGVRIYLLDGAGNWIYWNVHGEDTLQQGWNLIKFWTYGNGAWRNYDGSSATLPDATAITQIRIYFTVDAITITIAAGCLKFDYWHLGSRLIITEGTEISPLRLTDELFAHDQATALGVVTRSITNERKDTVRKYQFSFSCWIDIGDGTTATYVYEEERQIQMEESFSYGAQELRVMANAIFRAGRLINATQKTTARGVTFIALNNYPSRYGYIINGSGNKALLYGCTMIDAGVYDGKSSQGVWNKRLHFGNYGVAYNCTMINLQSGIEGTNLDVFNVLIKRGFYGFSYPSTGTFEKITLYECYYGFYPYTLYNIIAKNVYTRFTYYLWRPNAITVVCKGINVDSDLWNFLWIGTSTAKVYRQYEFDAHCQDKSGNSLSGVSAIGEYISPYGQAFSVTTDVNGDIATQTVDRSWYEQATGNTENLKTPLKVTYRKAGYQTVVKYYQMIEKTKDVVVLHKAVSVFLDFGRPVVNLKKYDPENKSVIML